MSTKPAFIIVLSLLIALTPLSYTGAAQVPQTPENAPETRAEHNRKIIQAAREKNRTQTDGENGKPRLMVQLGHSLSVKTAAFSPDGKQVMTTDDQTAEVWDVETGRELVRMVGHFEEVNSLIFSPDGRRIVTADGYEKTAQVWDVEIGKKLALIKGHSDQVTSVGFSPDGKRVVTASGSFFRSKDNTARVWDSVTGKELARMIGHTQKIHCAKFSPNGKRIVTASDDKTARVWDAETGKELVRLEGHFYFVNSAAFSPDGKWIVTASFDRTARVWDAETGKELVRLEGHSDDVESAVFSPDGKRIVTASDDKTARVWDAETGKELVRLEGHSDSVISAAFSPDGKQMVTASGKMARVWDMETGKELGQMEGHSDSVMSVAFSPDGKRIVTASLDETARVWDAANGKELLRFGRSSTTTLGDLLESTNSKTGKEFPQVEGHSDRVWRAVFSPDGERIVTASSDKTARVWDAETGKELMRLEGHFDWVESVAFSPDGKRILTSDTGSLDFEKHKSIDCTVRMWDAEDGKELMRLEGHSDWVESVAFSPDGKRIVTASFDKTARVWDAVTGKELMRMEGHLDNVNSAAFSPDGKHVVTASQDGFACIWDAGTGDLIQVFVGHLSGVSEAQFSLDGKYVVTSGRDGTTRLWDPPTGKERCQMISFRDGTWAVVDPEGRYDASNGGDVQGMHWVIGEPIDLSQLKGQYYEMVSFRNGSWMVVNSEGHSGGDLQRMHWVEGTEPIALSQLKSRYYDPGLLAKIMGFSKEPLRDVQAFRDVKLYPGVKYDAPKPGTTQTNITLTNQGGGIGKVVVKVNGQEVIADARGPKPDPDAKQVTLPVDLKGLQVIPGKENTIEVTAYNSEGYLASRGIKVIWTPDGKAENREQHFYAIVGGISDYAGDKIDLKFAAKDADDFAKALELGATKLFGADKVHLTMLTDSQDPTKAPTKANFRKAFEDIGRNAKPDDIFVMYLAGHGVTLKGSEIYCYLTGDAGTSNPEELANDKILREATAITDEELFGWIKGVAALKRVMVLDTCAAAAVAANWTSPRDIPSDQIRVLDRLKDRTGFYILMGSAADAVSYEANVYRQGLLTYSLLEWMKAGELKNGKFVEISSLFSHAVDRVPQLAKGIGGIQQPRIITPTSGQPFEIGLLEKAEREKILLESPKPLVLRPTFLNKKRPVDDLKLSEAIRVRLREETENLARGGGGLVYLDVEQEDLPDALLVSGYYSTDEQTVTVELLIRKNDKDLVDVKLTHPKADLPGLVDTILVKLKGAQ